MVDCYKKATVDLVLVFFMFINKIGFQTICEILPLVFSKIFFYSSFVMFISRKTSYIVYICTCKVLAQTCYNKMLMFIWPRMGCRSFYPGSSIDKPREHSFKSSVQLNRMVKIHMLVMKGNFFVMIYKIQYYLYQILKSYKHGKKT